jgi:EAL domain-containing protein (putative c-di-GMP-specific phosphodiesterase class I)
LSLEVTETAVMDRLEDARTALLEIAGTGIAIAIDDFGTGHSSIARLRELPVASVKVDRSFIAQLGTDASADRVLAAMIDLAHALGLAVVAEGVESGVHLARVRELGCDCAQGYHVAQPVPADEMLRVIREPASRAAG